MPFVPISPANFRSKSPAYGKKTEKTEIAVKNTVKREKKLKKQLKETKKDIARILTILKEK